MASARSFSLSIDTPGEARSQSALAWSWSANVRHSIVLAHGNTQALVRRWDAPDAGRTFAIVSSSDAQAILEALEQSSEPTAPTVIDRALNAFRLCDLKQPSTVAQTRTRFASLIACWHGRNW